MSYVLTETDRLPQGKPAAETKTAKAPAAKAPSFWQRFVAAMIESRRRSVERELRARSHLLGDAELILGGYIKASKSADDLPFGR